MALIVADRLLHCVQDRQQGAVHAGVRRQDVFKGRVDVELSRSHAPDSPVPPSGDRGPMVRPAESESYQTAARSLRRHG
jgi:hypothetical protein